jgi:Tol biopolymer transport system component
LVFVVKGCVIISTVGIEIYNQVILFDNQDGVISDFRRKAILIDPAIQINTELKRSSPIFFIILSLMIATIACRIGLPPPPTPGPFPFEGVRQVTFDYAFYKELMWSPDGEHIATTRCPVMNFEPSCRGNEEPLLIDVVNWQANIINLQAVSSNRITGYPIIWSPDGEELLLLIDERIPEEESVSVQSRTRKISYKLDTGTYSEVEITGGIIAWSRDGTSLLMIRSVNDDLEAIGWYDIENGDFRQEILLTEEDYLYWPYVLSPDERTLLRSDSPFTSSCNELESYTLGSREAFKTFLSLSCFPAWSHDGSKLAYTAKFDDKGLPNRLMIANRDGSNPISLFDDTTPHELAYPTWSPDGSQIAFTMGAIENANAIYIVDVPEHLQPDS